MPAGIMIGDTERTDLEQFRSQSSSMFCKGRNEAAIP
jgi:hypothetical protein